MDLPQGTACRFCKHVYTKPCHGESQTCPNALWIRSGRDVNKYKREADKLFVPKPKPVERIEEPQPKPKKGRVRL